MKIMSKIDSIIYRILTAISIGCFVGIFLIMILNVFFRWFPILSNIPNFSMGWFDEIIEMLVAWLIFTGAAMLSRNRDHFRVDIIQMKLVGKGSLYILESVIDIATIIFFMVLLYYSISLFEGAVQTTPVLRLQKRWFYLCIPFSSSLILIYSIRDLVLNVRGFFSSHKNGR